MEIPKIDLNGKTFIMSKIKNKLYKATMKLQEDINNINKSEIYDNYIEIIVIAFNHPQVTFEAIDENIGLDEISGLFIDIQKYVSFIMSNKFAELKN